MGIKWLITQQRYLTQNEKSLAQSVFGEHLLLDNIKIIAHRLIIRGYAMSPNGHIYFNPHDFCDDFALQPLHIQSWLIHELVHVWQIQQGIRVVRKAIFNRKYRYVIEYGKNFLQYGVEQQAQMVQDYFIKSRQNMPCDELKACIPFV